MDNAFWIIIVYFALSALGGLLSRHGKKAVERQRSRPTPATQDDPGGIRAATSQPSARQTPEDIAAEIRRVMGLEREESRVEVVEEVYDDPIESATAYDFDPEPIAAEPDHGGRLHDRLSARVDAAPGTLENRQLGTGIAGRDPGSSSVGGLAARYATGSVGRALVTRPAADHRGSSYVEISDMAKALVTMEVLGPPVALRDDGIPGLSGM